MPLVILIGASGSGKTTIARAIDHRYAEQVEVFYFDRIGVPPVQEMIAEYGSGEEWQRAKTLDWMAKLARLAKSESRLLFEGQTRLSFLEEGASAAGGLAYFPILLDCDDETRSKRLAIERNQPELADEKMMNWARYLRSEAKRRGCEILDTSTLSLDEGVSYVMARLGKATV
ncbi:MAG: AAA family ATPase [Hyphomicrobiales bacterium]|nr:AAA family ATPase [Hyphomicrobiales bacterium]